MASDTDTKPVAAEGGFWETLRVIVHALILAVLLRTFLYQSFNVPSGSMIPTLAIGDYLFVSKFSYGYSKYALPWSPNLFSGRIWAAEPKRGDVVVFKLPRDTSQDYVKRLVGLPGDRIQMIGGVLNINGVAVQTRRVEDYVGLGSTCNEGTNEIRVPRYIETLPGGVAHQILDCGTTKADNTEAFTVPAGHYFMMGDNRDNSIDSRFFGWGVGFVPAENLVGRAEILYFSVNETASLYAPWRWPAEIRWSRIFNLIR